MVFIVTSFGSMGCRRIVPALATPDNRENRDSSVDFYGCPRVDLVHPLAALAEDLPALAELDINPVLGIRTAPPRWTPASASAGRKSTGARRAGSRVVPRRLNRALRRCLSLRAARS